MHQRREDKRVEGREGMVRDLQLRRAAEQRLDRGYVDVRIVPEPSAE